ncbi:MAG: hypothetical protein WC314_22110 [Vulcanimicrobiota bacterium]
MVQTSVLTMQNSRGQELDLVSAVHVGSPTYYGELNKRFKGYDAVLYELILPDEMAGQALPAQMNTGSGVSGIQGMIAKSMGLTTQIEKINYTAPNFVHADLTRNGLAQKMAERQENLMTYMMKALGSSGSMDQSQLGVTDEELAELDLMAVMSGRTSAKDRKVLRKLFGSAMGASGGLLAGLGDSALIADRNQAALKVARREVQSGKRRIALFYGAAHMPDLKKQLESEGWKRVRTDWVTAWDV